MSVYIDPKTIESIAADKFGKTENFRELLDALGVTPFNVELLPEFTLLTPEILQNEQAIAAKVNEMTTQTVLVDGTEKLSAAIERISWLF